MNIKVLSFISEHDDSTFSVNNDGDYYIATVVTADEVEYLGEGDSITVAIENLANRLP